MQFNEFWDIIEQKNPQLASGKITMPSDSFKKAMQLAYDQGGVEQKKSSSLKNSLGYDSGNLFGDIFGKK